MALAISHLLFTAASVKLTLWLSLCMSNFSLDFFLTHPSYIAWKTAIMKMLTQS